MDSSANGHQLSQSKHSPRSWFLRSSYPQPNLSTADLCPLLVPEPPPHRPSHPSTASALTPVRPVPAPLISAGLFSLLWNYLGFSQHSQELQAKGRNKPLLLENLPPHPISLQNTGLPSWGRASPTDGAGHHAPTCPGQWGERRGGIPFPHQHQSSSGLSRH